MAPHRIDDMPGAEGADLSLSSRAEGDQHGIVVLHGMRDRVRVENVPGPACEMRMIRFQR